MKFTEITIFTSQQGLEALPLTLEEFGATGFVLNDPGDFENFLSKTVIHWDYLEENLMEIRNSTPYVRFYVADNSQGEALLLRTKACVESLKISDTQNELGSLEMIVTTVDEEDWENNWKAYFKPFRVGEHIYVKPSWETILDDEGRTVLEIDPASSFGTGTHHTTQLCLCAVEGLDLDGKNVLDMGCGSGILGVCALLFGAEHVTAVDIDENCIKTTTENMERNHISPEKYTKISGDPHHNLKKLYALPKFDVIFANIVADVIIGMAGDFAKLLQSSGTLIASGIISMRREEVRSALEGAGFTVAAEFEQADWICFHCIRS